MTDNVLITIAIDRQVLRDLLCTAVESGACNYWAKFSNATRTDTLDYLKVRVTEHEKHDDDKPRRNIYVTAEDMSIGIQRLASIAADDERRAQFPAAAKHLADALSDHDSATADVVLQMTVFGDVVYG